MILSLHKALGEKQTSAQEARRISVRVAMRQFMSLRQHSQRRRGFKLAAWKIYAG
jgi:hypothetical protein